VGLTRAVPSPHLRAYFDWLAAGQHGPMGYMGRPDRVARRRDLGVILPGARTLIVVGLDYHTLRLPKAVLDDPGRGRIAAYAWGRDYHAVMLPRLRALAGWLEAQSAERVASRAYVDTGAILERSHAQQAGLGFVGKNTMLIHRRRGSDFFLGEVLTTAGCDAYDAPESASLCGRCTRCLAACPTEAFPQPYVLDARRCISTLTIEDAGWIDRALRPRMGNWVFGCDVCQAVCPWQRFAIQTQETEFYPLDADRAAPPLAELLDLTPESFARRFAGSAVLRAGRDQLVRNACLAAANGGQANQGLRPRLEALLREDASAVVRGHAGWALARLAGPAAGPALGRALKRETDAEARADLEETAQELALPNANVP
jgi:epoxyqueuosine reductase